MQQSQRGRWDTPEMQAYRREVREATFTKEGMMVAFPTCFPGMTTPIVPDESRITALGTTASGTIFGGTSGYQAHLFAAEFHGIMGVVFDLGVMEGATECVGVCCGKTHLAAFVNGPKGGRAVQAPLIRMDSDLIQEWGFERPALKDLGQCVAGEPVVHAVMSPESEVIVGATTGHVFTLDLKTGRIQVAGEALAGGKLARTSRGAILGRDSDNSLWRFRSGNFDLQARMPSSCRTAIGTIALSWARDPSSGVLYTADAAGRLYSFEETAGFSGPLGQVPVAPVGPMAVTFDGRLFGFCGEEIARLFCYDPAIKKVAALGGAASVIERRRYGYVFGDAVTGRDGEIVFGENDNGGHVWLYFPRIKG